jgi:hypothetical protein
MTMLRRSAAALAVLALVAACSRAGGPTASPGPAASPSAIAPSPTAAPSPLASVNPTPTPVPTEAPRHCPTASPMSPIDYMNADPACFGSRDVEILAWEDDPAAVGWEGPAIQPSWLAYPPAGLSALWSSPPSGPDHMCHEAGCGWFFLHVAPDTGLTLPTTPGWVIVTGHSHDAVAATCHYDLSSAEPPVGPVDDADARSQCEDSFVLTGVRPAAAPSQRPSP